MVHSISPTSLIGNSSDAHAQCISSPQQTSRVASEEISCLEGIKTPRIYREYTVANTLQIRRECVTTMSICLEYVTNGYVANTYAAKPPRVFHEQVFIFYTYLIFVEIPVNACNHQVIRRHIGRYLPKFYLTIVSGFFLETSTNSSIEFDSQIELNSRNLDPWEIAPCILRGGFGKRSRQYHRSSNALA